MMTSIVRLPSNKSQARTNQNARMSYYIICNIKYIQTHLASHLYRQRDILQRIVFFYLKIIYSYICDYFKISEQEFWRVSSHGLKRGQRTADRKRLWFPLGLGNSTPDHVISNKGRFGRASSFQAPRVSNKDQSYSVGYIYVFSFNILQDAGLRLEAYINSLISISYIYLKYSMNSTRLKSFQNFQESFGVRSSHIRYRLHNEERCLQVKIRSV